MALNLRKRQIDSIFRFISTGSGPAKEELGSFRVLVLDKFTKLFEFLDKLSPDIIAPLLRVSDLRKHGVTLHLLIESERQSIPDVPAIYFLAPTEANMELLAQDAKNGLYETMHLNFTTTLPSKLMEQLANATVRNGGVQRIGKLFDQYLSFVALEPTLFSLGLPDAYMQLNDPMASDTQIEVCCMHMHGWTFQLLQLDTSCMRGSSRACMHGVSMHACRSQLSCDDHHLHHAAYMARCMPYLPAHMACRGSMLSLTCTLCMLIGLHCQHRGRALLGLRDARRRPRHPLPQGWCRRGRRGAARRQAA